MKTTRILKVLLTVALVSSYPMFWAMTSRGQAPPSPGFIIQRDSEVAKSDPGPHNGTGRTTGYDFFGKVPDTKFFFRKRVLHPGASIGYHKQDLPEIYYVLSGTGKMKMNGEDFAVHAGDAILTLTGSSHGLTQTGDADLAIMIAYDKH